MFLDTTPKMINGRMRKGGGEGSLTRKKNEDALFKEKKKKQNTARAALLPPLPLLHKHPSTFVKVHQ